MKTTFFKSVFCISFLFIFLSEQNKVFSQTVDLGGPKSWQEKVDAGINKVSLPPIDVEELKSEDEVNYANKVGPYRFGYEHILDIDFFENATQTTHEDGGQIFRLEFSAKNAKTMNIFFLEYKLGEGETVHVYDKNGRYYDGAYTAANNQPDGLLGTIPIPANKIILEYYRPVDLASQSKLRIGHVVEGYRDVAQYFVGALREAKGLNDSGSCNYDTGCSELPNNPFGDPGEWNDQIASVSLMLLNGSRICSAALINNTANDGTPYILSANHCGTSNGGGRSFLFGYESPSLSCASSSNSSDGPTTNVMNGATLRASNSGSDVALWELNSDIPSSYEVYYAGWDRSGTPPTEVTGIHHPSGDVKKMCREEDAPYQDNAAGASVWWIDNWEYGVTEPGSSGSPIFDQNKRIVGQLYGGLAACSGTSNNGSYDYYGRFDVSWDGGSSASTRLEDWLDPLGFNPLVLDGFDPNQPSTADDAFAQSISGVQSFNCNQTEFSPSLTLRNAGSNTLTSVAIDYSLDGQSLGSFIWTGALATNQEVEVSIPSFSVENSGFYSFEVSLSNPNGAVDEDASNDSVTVPFEVSVDAESAQLSLTFDCWANEVSWELVSDDSGEIIASGDGYSGDLDGVTIAQEFCLGEGCYTFNIFDSFGDGLYGSQYGSCSFDGDYSITDSEGNVLVEMTAPNADYGDSATHNFCIESDEVPCENPYPMAQNLNSQVLANGVLLTWDPIIGSFNCQVNGGIVGNPGNASFLTNEPNSGSFFVPQGALISGNEYRWRVRCACTFQIRGPFTPFNFFSWGAPGSSFSGILSSETVFPNPVANEKLNVQLDFAGAPVTASFYDMQGRLIKQEFLGDTATMITQFDVSDFQSGVYILQLNNGSETVTHKFVKK